MQNTVPGMQSHFDFVEGSAQPANGADPIDAESWLALGSELESRYANLMRAGSGNGTGARRAAFPAARGPPDTPATPAMTPSTMQPRTGDMHRGGPPQTADPRGASRRISWKDRGGAPAAPAPAPASASVPHGRVPATSDPSATVRRPVGDAPTADRKRVPPWAKDLPICGKK